MILVVTQLILQIHHDDDAAGNADGQTDCIDDAVQLISAQQPDSEYAEIRNHKCFVLLVSKPIYRVTRNA
jgi:hypothetical protein